MSIIIMILLLSFLVLVHEAGHFFSARMLGIKVSKFGFGLPIGPTLWSKKFGDVEVLVHAFLLGGYVSFPDDEKDSDLPKDSSERFTNKPVWQRMVVISAGVIANVLAALFLVLVTAFAWGRLPSGEYKVFINDISQDKAYTIIDSGLQKDDQIIKINGVDINSAYALTLFAKNSIPYDAKILEKDLNSNLEKLKLKNPKLNENEIISKDVKILLPKKEEESPLILDKNTLKGYKLYKDLRLQLTPSQIKLRDNLKSETVYIADGTTTLKDIAYAITDSKQPINITVLRNGKELAIKPAYPSDKGILGVQVSAQEILKPTKSFTQAISGSCSYLWEQTYMLVYGLVQLFTGKIPVKDLHGIVVITKIGGDVIQNSGFFSGLLLTAMISMDLALVNFLPIPALDGGHFMFLIIEKLRGKPLDEETLNKISTVFFMLLLVFMVLVIFNDIYALVRHKL